MGNEVLANEMYPLGNPNNIKTWTDFLNLYGTPFYNFKNKPEFNRFVKDYFLICEQSGFSSKYWTSLGSKYNGKPYKVLGRHWGFCFPMWLIEFEDGRQKFAYAEEIIPHEMKAIGCPFTDYDL